MSGGRAYRRRIAAAAVDAGPADLPSWVTDQLQAASAEMGAGFTAATRQLAPFGYKTAAVQATPDLRAELLSCLLRCRVCPHLRGVPGPVYVNLSNDRAVCRACVARRQVGRPDPANDDRCDLCETHGHDRFREVAVVDGNMEFHFNLAACCWAKFGIDDGET